MNLIHIYQLKFDSSTIFRSFDESNFNFSYYEKVYTCVRNSEYGLEDAFFEFNAIRPKDFRGHSLSVSDVVSINDKYYFCDSFGWEDVTEFIH